MPAGDWFNQSINLLPSYHGYGQQFYQTATAPQKSCDTFTVYRNGQERQISYWYPEDGRPMIGSLETFSPGKGGRPVSAIEVLEDHRRRCVYLLGDTEKKINLWQAQIDDARRQLDAHRKSVVDIDKAIALLRGTDADADAEDVDCPACVRGDCEEHRYTIADAQGHVELPEQSEAGICATHQPAPDPCLHKNPFYRGDER